MSVLTSGSVSLSSLAQFFPNPGIADRGSMFADVTSCFLITAWDVVSMAN